MGQFKPMVKMETTEPSVILKLKKGGVVKMKNGGSATKKMAMGGGAMGALAGTPALVGRPAINAPVQAPGKPSMAMRRKAMMAKGMGAPSGPAMPAGNPGLPAMKKGGKSEMHDDAAEDRAMIKKAMAGKKFATGGVTDGQGGYANGGIIKTEGQGGEYRDTKMVTAKPNNSPAKTGGVKDGNGGGYATGGVTKSNGGGYRKGGAPKKFADGGKVQDDGGPEKMPQGRKPVSQPVEINALAGTFKRGGKVTPGNKVMQSSFNKMNAPAMREAKANSVESYAPMGSVVRGKRMNGGGASSDKLEDMSKGAYDKAPKYSRDLEDALNPLGMVKELASKAKNYFMPKSAGSVTKESITVTPAGKKRGGQAC